MAYRTNRVVDVVRVFENERQGLTRRSHSFLESVNSFLRDSGKALGFSDEGDLIVSMPDGRVTSAENLSSGELQLLLLFAFLYFHFDDPEQVFPIVIDEPELSLHPAWQNRYLESITSANDQAQFIVATHSPEIAGPFRDRVTDLSPGGMGGA